MIVRSLIPASAYVTTVELSPLSLGSSEFAYELRIHQNFMVYDFVALVPDALRAVQGSMPPLTVRRIIAEGGELPGFPINFWFLHDRMFSGKSVRPIFKQDLGRCSIMFDRILAFPVAARGRLCT